MWKALSDKDTKAKWFRSPGDDESTTWEMDFREGGSEEISGSNHGTAYRYSAQYFDIQEPTRLVYSYGMWSGGTKLSLSIASWELTPDGEGTTAVYTETMAILDRNDTVEGRRAGTEALLDQMDAILS